MTKRRPIGALEAQVLEALWARGEQTTPGEVQQALDGTLAYTTVMTVLTRLWRKGHVTRTKTGRAFAYAPSQSRDEFFADRMHHTLAAASDSHAVLSRFVDGLSAKEVAALRALLKEVEK